jgi:hypothetical protein
MTTNITMRHPAASANGIANKRRSTTDRRIVEKIVRTRDKKKTRSINIAASGVARSNSGLN